MKKRLLLLLAACVVVFANMSFSATAKTFTNEQNPYITASQEYISIAGIDNGFEPQMDLQTNAYAVVDEGAVFVLAYDWNTNSEGRSLGFKQTGLYENNADPHLIYSIPSPELESYAEVSKDGHDVWIFPASYLMCDRSELNLSKPVVQKFIDGELAYSVCLSDIFFSEFRLAYTDEYGLRWCTYLVSESVENPDYLVFQKLIDGVVIYIDRKTGEVSVPFRANMSNWMYWGELLFIPCVISFVVYALVVFFKRKRIAKTRKDKS